jgi:hypothetical protein
VNVEDLLLKSPEGRTCRGGAFSKRQVFASDPDKAAEMAVASLKEDDDFQAVLSENGLEPGEVSFDVDEVLEVTPDASPHEPIVYYMYDEELQ